MREKLTMKQIADKNKKGWSFVDSGKGVILNKHPKNIKIAYNKDSKK